MYKCMLKLWINIQVAISEIIQRENNRDSWCLPVGELLGVRVEQPEQRRKTGGPLESLENSLAIWTTAEHMPTQIQQFHSKVFI